MVRDTQICLGGSEYEISRSRLGGFLALQEAEELITKAVKDDDTGTIVDSLFRFLQISIPELPRENFSQYPWQEIIQAYNLIGNLNTIPEAEKFAILNQKIRGKEASWHFLGRSLYVWVHQIATAYHWTRKEILNLWPEDAVAHIQEIMADDYFQRSFSHALSPVAYPVEPGAKKAKYKPLDKPSWMIVGNPNRPNPIGRVPKELIPLGKIISSPARKQDIEH